jgi:hypothetical protein
MEWRRWRWMWMRRRGGRCRRCGRGGGAEEEVAVQEEGISFQRLDQEGGGRIGVWEAFPNKNTYAASSEYYNVAIGLADAHNAFKCALFVCLL